MQLAKMKRFFYALLTLVLLLPSGVSASVEDDAIILTHINPADSSTLVGFSNGDTITFATNADSIFGGFNVMILDTSTNNIVYEDFTVSKNGVGEWVLHIYDDLLFLKDRTYEVEMTGHKGTSPKSEAIAKVKAVYFGNATSSGEEDDSNYEYSNIIYLFFNPRDSSEYFSEDDNYLVIDFTGDVTVDIHRSIILDEDSVEIPFTRINALYGEKEHWEFIIPKEVLKNSTSFFKMHIFAKDMGGRAVKGNKGKGDNSYYELTYYCKIGYPKLKVNPSGLLRNLSKIVFSNDEGISIQEDMSSPIYLYEEDKETIKLAIEAKDLVIPEQVNTSIYYTLPDTLVEEGDYYLYVPENTFILGSKKKPNEEKWVTFQIVDKMGLYGVTIDPVEGSVLPKLSRIDIIFNRWNAVSPYSYNTEKIIVTDLEGDTVTTATAKVDPNDPMLNRCYIEMDTIVTQSGYYYVKIPEGAFLLGMNSLHSSPMVFEYEVEAPPPFIPELAVTTELDENITLRYVLVQFPQFELVLPEQKEGEAILKDTLGNELAKGKILIGRYRNQLCITLDEDFNRTTENDYVLTIPANSISMDLELYKLDLEIPFHFDPTTSGIRHADTASADTCMRVYNLQGILIREGDSKEVLEGLKGLYIINGRKILIK